jgi:Protein of unknown function (DUF2380)
MKGIAEMLNTAALMGAFVVASIGMTTAAPDDNALRVAFFGFRLINSSLEPTTAAEEGRIHQLDELFREKLAALGRFKLVAVPPEMQKEIDAGPEVSSCNGCERDFAERIGATRAAWGTVQKVSNLILNINVYMTDVQTGKPAFTRSVDIRGNTDESWRRGLDYLLRHYLLGEP